MRHLGTAADWSRIPGSAPAFGTEDIGQERLEQVLGRGALAGCHHGRSDPPLGQRIQRKHADIGQAGEAGTEGCEFPAVGIALAGQAEDAIGIQVAGVVPADAWLGGWVAVALMCKSPSYVMGPNRSATGNKKTSLRTSSVSVCEAWRRVFWCALQIRLPCF